MWVPGLPLTGTALQGQRGPAGLISTAEILEPSSGHVLYLYVSGYHSLETWLGLDLPLGPPEGEMENLLEDPLICKVKVPHI